MTKDQFLNRLRGLYFIDADMLPEITDQQRRLFLNDPVYYFIRADDRHSDAIWREIERRQKPLYDDDDPCLPGKLI